MSDRTIRRVPGYGSELRRRLAELGWSQSQLASSAGVSRQTIHRAINEDEVSDRTKEKIAKAIGRAFGTPSESHRQEAVPTSPGLGRALADATDLVAWAARLSARGDLPLLVRRLIQATVADLERLGMPAGEGVQLPDWDGIVRAGESTPYVPKGDSKWEMSTGKKPKAKADADWKKRTEDCGPRDTKDVTFVFVTLRRWPKKREWAKQKTAEGPYCDVRVLDAEDLATWLEEAPGVHVWVSERIGKIPEGVRLLASWWKEWSKATWPELTRQFLLARPSDAVSKLRQRLAEFGGQAVAIQGESQEEAMAWLYSGIRELVSEQADNLLERSLIVDSPHALRHLIPSKCPLVLVPTFEPEDLVPAAVRKGHMVIIPLDEAAPGNRDDVIQIGSLCRRTAASELEKMDDDIDMQRVQNGARLARRSLTVFRRSFARYPGQMQPIWSKPANARKALPALLAGSWTGNSGDGVILSRLARKGYEEVEEQLMRWSVGKDPLVRRRGTVWYLVSTQDAWSLLISYLMPDDLERFKAVAKTVLESVHPGFDVPFDCRWMAPGLGYSSEYSARLHGGLAKSLAIMGTDRAEVSATGRAVSDTAEQVVREVLRSANQKWELWESLSDHLPLLAEAAPDYFLDAVEEGLTAPEPALAKLFSVSGDPITAPNKLAGLLRALEVLAWSPDYFGRVVPLLARLDEADPESELRSEEPVLHQSHRPLSVLKAIFRSWLPGTSATPEERLAVLDRLRKSNDLVAWHVMLSMLPDWHAVGTSTSRPKVRDWSDSAVDADAGDEASTVAEVVDRVLMDAGSDGRRWAELLRRLYMFPGTEHDLVVTALRQLDPCGLGTKDRMAIWEALRAIVDRNRASDKAPWAMSRKRADRIQETFESFAHRDSAISYRHLFDGVDKGELDLQEVESRRAKAVADLFQQRGVSGLLDFARTVEESYDVGLALALVPLEPDSADQLTLRLANPIEKLAKLTLGYMTGRSRAGDSDWVMRQIDRTDLRLTTDQKVDLLRALPPRPDTWCMARKCGRDVFLGYWQGVYWPSISPKHTSKALDELLEADRPFAAADLLALNARNESGLVSSDGAVSPETAYRVLCAAATTDAKNDSPSLRFGRSVEKLLGALADLNFSQNRLAVLEWHLVPLLKYTIRKPDVLHKHLANKPDFFATMVSRVYISENDESPSTERDDENRARFGYSVLGSWRTIPGQQADGNVDADTLCKWIERVVSLLETTGHATIGHFLIGRMLSCSPHDSDGTWPCAAVRKVIESRASKDLDKGFRIGVYNSRGVVRKDATEGGASERAMADRYDGFAAAVRAACPRTARVLRDLAEQYRREAAQEDLEMELREDR